MVTVRKDKKIKVGDIYSDCSYHPVLCLTVDRKNDAVEGISLFDGSEPRSCSLIHCSVYVMPALLVAYRIRNKYRWLQAEKLFREGKFDGTGYIPLLTEEREKFGEL